MSGMQDTHHKEGRLSAHGMIVFVVLFLFFFFFFFFFFVIFCNILFRLAEILSVVISGAGTARKIGTITECVHIQRFWLVVWL
jgi:hypothetical protein